MADRDETRMSSGDPGESGEDTRRAFLKKLGIGGLGAGLGAVIVVPVGAAVVYPLQHQTVSGADAFMPVGSVDRFQEGKPTKVDIYADKRDAWNRVENVKIGSAWVIRRDGELKAYSTVCPHLGCAIDYDAEKNRFKCPCHRSSFTLNGEVQGGPAPRDMDALDVKKDDGQVAIRYRRFKQGISDKEPV